MADNLPTVLKEELTCHICTEIYTDPVQLPCQHSFCRECLKVYVSSDKVTSSIKNNVFKNKDEVDVTHGVSKSPVESNAEFVSCPVCRKLVELDTEAVSNLPVHFTIANIVEKYQTEVKKDVSLKCSMCDDKQPRIAVKGCVTCRCLYCQECLKVMHPMRGPLAEHSLVEAENYALTPLCEEHKEPLKVFCGDCKKLYCFPCSFANHNGHDLKKPDVVFSDEKDRLALKTNVLRVLQREMQLFHVQSNSVMENINMSFKDEAADVESKYQDTLKALDSWKSACLEAIYEKQGALLRQTGDETKRLDTQLNELSTCVESAADLAGQTDSVQYLLASEAMLKRMEDVCSTTADILKTYHKSVLKVEAGIKNKKYFNELVYLVNERGEDDREYRVIHPPIRCPEFSLNKEKHDSVLVRYGGKLLVNVRQCVKPGNFYGALADQSYAEGRVYWETDVSYTVKKDLQENSIVYSAGALQQSKTLPKYPGIDKNSWGVTIQQKFPFSFSCQHNKVSACTLPVHPDDNTQDAESGWIRQGFYLDCASRTFTIVDCTHNRVLHTFHDVDLSEPLTPAVTVYNFTNVDVSVRLRTGRDISSLPTCLYKELQGI